MKRAPIRRKKAIRVSSFVEHKYVTPRTPLRRVGSRASREKADIVAFRERVVERAAGYCERCLCRVGDAKIEAHHLVRRARCVGWPLRHHPECNGLGVCNPCHRSLTLDPEDAGGPAEHAARRAHREFEAWRAEQ